MDTEFLLIIILSFMTLLLSILFILRIIRESRQLAVIRRMDLVEFAEFLRSNSVDGNIQAVAGKVSKLLTNSFGCERIIFLRKKRGSLALNFYRGISNFNRRDFHLLYSQELGEKLSADFLPMKIEKFQPMVPGEFYNRLAAFGVDTYFPIYWRNNLYGIYFIKSNLEVRTPAFTLMVASLAQSLSAAYHIKWHESRLSNLEKKFESSLNSNAIEKSAEIKFDTSEAELLPLVKIRDTNILVPKILNKLGEDLQWNRFSYVFGAESDENSTQSVSKGVDKDEQPPDSELFNSLYASIKGHGIQSVDRLKESKPELAEWLADLKHSGLEYVTEFSLTKERPGVLAFSGAEPSAAVQSKLESYRLMTADLIENAEDYKQAEIMSYTDALTELSNQRYMYKRLNEEINRAHRYARPLGFIIFDIDELKIVNDSYGHLAGDALIKQVGQSLKKSIRAIDIVARYGGDEFCVVMPESDEETCVKFMKRMIETISKTDIKLPEISRPHHCSISMGAALYPVHAQEAQKLVHAADMALLKAKGRGRNRYLVYTPEPADSKS